MQTKRTTLQYSTNKIMRVVHDRDHESRRVHRIEKVSGLDQKMCQIKQRTQVHTVECATVLMCLFYEFKHIEYTVDDS